MDTTLKIKVVGVGGAGCNCINRILVQNSFLPNVEFLAISTNADALSQCLASEKILLNGEMNPNIVQQSAEANVLKISAAIKNANIVFIVAGLGGGTGTGASPIVARAARELGILTIAVAITPFDFEGQYKINNATIGLSNLTKFVDAYVIMSNQRLTETLAPKTPVQDAFKTMDETLVAAIEAFAGALSYNWALNCDYHEIETALKNAGCIYMGIGHCKGKNAVTKSLEDAANNHLTTTTIKGAKKVLLFYTTPEKVLLDEVAKGMEELRQVTAANCDIKFALQINSEFKHMATTFMIATGMPNIEFSN